MARPLRRRPRQAWDSIHLITSVGWLGVGLSQLTLNVVAATRRGGAVPVVVHDIAHVLDLAVLAPLALGALVSGVVRAVRSKWGLLRHWWVAVKLVLTSLLFVADPLWLGAWNVAAATLAARSTDSAEYAALGRELLAGSLVNIVLLGFMVVISVCKPWGRIRPGERGRVPDVVAGQ